jgi:hypothetical protein
VTKVVVAGKSDHIANDGDAQRISRGFLPIMLVQRQTQRQPDPRHHRLGQSKSSVIDHVYQYVAPGAAHPVFGERMTATSCSWCSWGISVGVF